MYRNHDTRPSIDETSRFDRESIGVIIAQTDNKGLCWLYAPEKAFTWKYFVYSWVGVEHLHSYMWILKDFAWMQGFCLCGMFFGSLATLWSGYLIHLALLSKDIAEIWNSIGLFLWLFANTWWMFSDLHDWYNKYDDDYTGWYHNGQKQAGHIFIAAVSWLAVYWVIIKPIAVLKPNWIKNNDFGLYLDSKRQVEAHSFPAIEQQQSIPAGPNCHPLSFSGNCDNNSIESHMRDTIVENKYIFPRFSFFFNNWREVLTPYTVMS